MNQVIRKIARSENFGSLLAEDPLRLARDAGYRSDVHRLCAFLGLAQEKLELGDLRESLRRRLGQVAVGKWM